MTHFNYGAIGFELAGVDVPTVVVNLAPFDIVTTPLPSPAVYGSNFLPEAQLVIGSTDAHIGVAYIGAPGAPSQFLALSVPTFPIQTILGSPVVQALVNPGIVTVSITIPGFDIVTAFGNPSPVAQGQQLLTHRVLPPEVRYSNPIPPTLIQDATIGPTTTIESRLEILNADGTLYMSDFDLMGGTITVSLDRDERRTIELEIHSTPTTRIDHHPGGLWYDKIIVPYRGIRSRITTSGRRRSGASTSTASATPDFPARGQHQWARPAPRSCSTTSSPSPPCSWLSEAPEDVIRCRRHQRRHHVASTWSVTGKTLGRGHYTFEHGTSRWEIISKIAEAFSLEVFFDSNGVLVLRHLP
jgi:hypothetical protein